MSGRTLPSRPIRAFNCGTASAEHRGLAATAFAPNPAVHAIAPSDMCGWDSTIRLAWSDGFVCRLSRFAFIALTVYAQTRLAPAGVSAATASAMLLVAVVAGVTG
ncbi:MULTISPECIES: hypothetical protein [Kitasatospora]|uniref:hypothetical protein n=1 Tax=Kitasatospora TaxID=2063 RepID=UPI00117C9391|nr:hypothetical protein [Kitasatospora sp. GP30]MDH6145680.1 hypothetical protein [Kitasatospora sp. GP30]